MRQQLMGLNSDAQRESLRNRNSIVETCSCLDKMNAEPQIPQYMPP